MGLLDRLRGRKSDGTANQALVETSNESLIDPASIEKAIAERFEKIDLDKCLKIGFNDVTALGTAFAQFIPSLRTATVDGMGYIPVNMGDYDILKRNKDGLYYGAHVTPSGKSVMTKWIKGNPIHAELPVNPTMLLMAATLANINRKLDMIQQTQMKILSFLEQDKQAEQQGNLNVLTDILCGYKFNWDNAQFLQNNHMKALDIRQSAEKNLLFYQTQIADAIRNMPAICIDQQVNSIVSKLTALFKDYRMAVYLFSFASYLDVMLLGNFQQGYLDQIADKLHQYDEHYQSQFSQCRDLIQKFAGGSIETKLLTGIGNASRALGKLIGSSSVLSRGSVDEWLEENGEKLLRETDAKGERIGSFFSINETIGSKIFEESIQNVGLIHNQTKEIIIKQDALYLNVCEG